MVTQIKLSFLFNPLFYPYFTVDWKAWSCCFFSMSQCRETKIYKIFLRTERIINFQLVKAKHYDNSSFFWEILLKVISFGEKLLFSILYKILKNRKTRCSDIVISQFAKRFLRSKFANNLGESELDLDRQKIFIWINFCCYIVVVNFGITKKYYRTGNLNKLSTYTIRTILKATRQISNFRLLRSEIPI